MPPTPGRGRDLDSMIDRARRGDPRAVARLVSLVEDGAPELRELLAALAPLTGKARLIGLTGAPGVGKSTLTSALLRAFRAEGSRVGVLAVDPSSPFTGGALLGDRVRMQDHAADRDVFIRSMASRGHLGGLAAATGQAVRVLDAAGYGVILVETVGVGQAEVEVASLADSTLVLAAPGMGDAIQAAKAGILEIADLFVVNKADRDDGAWKPPITKTVAASGEGIDDLVAQLARHAAWLEQSGELERRHVARARDEVTAIALAVLRKRMGEPDGVAGQSALGELARRVADGGLDPFSAADQLVDLVGAGSRGK